LTFNIGNPSQIGCAGAGFKPAPTTTESGYQNSLEVAHEPPRGIFTATSTTMKSGVYP
jgi:hypothetical protein